MHRQPAGAGSRVPRQRRRRAGLHLWLVWFANYGLSLAAADCALPAAPRSR